MKQKIHPLKWCSPFWPSGVIFVTISLKQREVESGSWGLWRRAPCPCGQAVENGSQFASNDFTNRHTCTSIMVPQNALPGWKLAVETSLATSQELRAAKH